MGSTAGRKKAAERRQAWATPRAIGSELGVERRRPIDYERLDRAESYARRVQVHLAERNYVAARAVIDQWEREEAQGGTLADKVRAGLVDQAEVLASPLAELGISLRAQGDLEQFGLRTIEDVARLSRAELLRVPGVRDKTLREIVNAVVAVLPQE